MINAEHIIKRKAVSHDAYAQNSDDEEKFLQFEMGNGRTHSRQKRGNGYNSQQKQLRRRKKRQYDPAYYDNDSDFESAEEDDDEQKTEPSKKSMKQQSFHKVAIQPSISSMRPQSSALAVILASVPIPNEDDPYIGRRAVKKGKPGGYGGRNGHHSKNGHYGDPQQNHSKYARYEVEEDPNFTTFKLTVYFGEYLQEEPIKLDVTYPWSVGETITKAIKQWNIERPLCKLKGQTSNHYDARCMDDDEIDDDVPAYGKHLKIHTLGEQVIGLRYIGGIETGPSSYDKANEVLPIQNQNETMLLRVSIPGPNNESHVLAIDKDHTAMTLRDLISVLNKKKHSAHFHAQYFNFYFEGRTKLNDALNLGRAIIDLEVPTLVLLPKFLTQNDDVNEAYNFHLVKLANEQREYHCTKVRTGRKNKKRLLIVDRHRIVKKEMDDYNIGRNDHVPIDILSIKNITINDKNNKQFTIEYRKPQAGGSRVQVYELENIKECKEFVSKVRYLHTLRKLQGI